MDCSRARTKNPSDWIQLAPDFSREMAETITDWFLNWEPDLQVSIKWNMLCFTGRKLVCGLSACQKHLGITFFRGTELRDPAHLFAEGGANNTNIRSIRLRSLDRVAPATLRKLLHAAVALDADTAFSPPPKVKRKPWPMPAFFKQALALRQNQAAADNFQRFAPTYQREYLVWLSTARQPETRRRRLQETLAALAAGRKWAQRKLV